MTNLENLGATTLIAALLNPSLAPQARITARAGDSVVWAGAVESVTRSGTTLAVRGYAPALSAPTPIDSVELDFRALSLRSGVGGGDVSFIDATPRLGLVLEFRFALRSEYQAPPGGALPAPSNAERIAALETILIGDASALVAQASDIAAERVSRERAGRGGVVMSVRPSNGTRVAERLSMAKPEHWRVMEAHVLVRGASPGCGHIMGFDAGPNSGGGTLSTTNVYGVPGTPPSFFMRKEGGIDELPLESTAPAPVGRAFYVGCSFDEPEGMKRLFLDGVEVASAPTDNSTINPALFGCGMLGWGGGGGFVEAALFNRLLTAGERARLMLGEIPAELAHPAVNTPPCEVVNGRTGFATATAFTGVSGAESRITGTFGPYSGAMFRPARTPRFGQSVRISILVTSFTGSVAGTAYLFSNEAPFQVDEGQITFSANGLYTITTKLNKYRAGMSLGLAVMNAGNAGSWTGTVSLMEMSYLGTIEHYRPDAVTGSGRWVGNYGNDLIPGENIAPVAPRPARRESALVRYDMTATATRQSFGGATATKAATGVLDVAWPSWVTEEMMPALSIVCSDATGGTFIAPFIHVAHDIATLGRVHRVYLRRADTRALTDYSNVEAVLSWTE